MFVLAHLFLFTFHLPSRYTQHSLRILMALVGGMFIAVVVATTSAWITRKLPKCLRVTSTCVTLVTGCVVVAGLVYPSYAVRAYPHRLGYLTGEAASLYRFLRQQPQDVLVASLTPEADFIPTFAQRSVLVSQEYAIPYHTGYYRQLRQRTLEMLSAQYSPEITPVQGLIQEYGIDLWLLERQAFQPGYIANNPWLMQFQPAASAAVDRMQQGKQPALARLLPACAVFAEQKWVVLDALCLLSAAVDD